MANPLSFDLSIVSNVFAHFDRGLVWWVFVAACIVYGIFTTILLFHWERYGFNNPRIIVAEIVYLVVSVQIVSLAYTSVTAFINHT